MKLRTYSAVIVGLCLMPLAAVAQAQTQTAPPPGLPSARQSAQATHDPPVGFPYNTVDSTQSQATYAQVPLRDFLSSRQDQQRAELIERIESLASRFQQILDERDRQYAQRFAAQQDAMEKALASAKELSAQALASAKEAVIKAESAADRRFEAGNEIKAAMAEQANSFVRISTAEARFNAIEEKLNSVYDRLNNIQAQSEGKADTWGWLVGTVGVLIAFGALLFNLNKSRQREH